MRTLFALLLVALSAAAQQPGLAFLNGNKPILDAHNCYPYEGHWTDRLQRALSAGFPVGIEQDLAWYTDPATGQGRIAVTHTKDTTGAEPGLRGYFFEPVRPLIEKALKDNDTAKWPLIVLHFDFKDNRPELLHAVWALLGDYEPWLVTAPNSPDPHHLSALTLRPILVLTEDSDEQEKVFFNEVPATGLLRLFGSAHTGANPGRNAAERAHYAATLSPQRLLHDPPTNYRRWWNNSWAEVEEGGQTRAGKWTPADARRLQALVNRAHTLGFWIRFYTLDGFSPDEDRGFTASYNFGSRDAAALRWKAAIAAGVNFIATDQYEDLGALIHQSAALR